MNHKGTKNTKAQEGWLFVVFVSLWFTLRAFSRATP